MFRLKRTASNQSLEPGPQPQPALRGMGLRPKGNCSIPGTSTLLLDNFHILGSNNQRVLFFHSQESLLGATSPRHRCAPTRRTGISSICIAAFSHRSCANSTSVSTRLPIRAAIFRPAMAFFASIMASWARYPTHFRRPCR